MIFKWLLTRLESLLSNPYFTFPFQTLVTVGLFILTNILVKDADVQLVAEMGLVAFWVFATWQTLGLQTYFRRYLTRELLEELGSSQGRVISRLVLSTDFEEIHPWSRHTVDFTLEAKQLLRGSWPKQLTPVLRMEPPLFRGHEDSASGQFSTWRGKPIACHVQESSICRIQGTVQFDTFDINPDEEPSSEVTLSLHFQEGQEIPLDASLEHVPVHLVTRQQVFREIIRIGAVKKLPPGYHVLPVSRDKREHTNLVFLPAQLVNQTGIEDWHDQRRRLELALARFVREELAKIADEGLRLVVEAYKPKPWEEELNSSPLLEAIASRIRVPEPDRPTGEVKVTLALYQTRDFTIQLSPREFGVCLFGFRFPQSHLPQLRMVYDLCQLGSDRTGDNDPCKVGLTDLRYISESTTENLRKNAETFADTYAKNGRSGKSDAEKSLDKAAIAKEGQSQSQSLAQLLGYIHNRHGLEDCSLHGCFVTSEPARTDYWIDLGVFEDALDVKARRALCESVNLIIDRCVEAYGIETSKLSILSLCCEKSGIADELETLWDHSHPRYGIHPVAVNLEAGEVEVPHEVESPTDRREIILLTPVDSYAPQMKAVLDYVTRRRNSVICVVSLFAVAATWDYLGSTQRADVIPLFRIAPGFRRGLEPLTEMRDYQRLRPWLFAS